MNPAPQPASPAEPAVEPWTGSPETPLVGRIASMLREEVDPGFRFQARRPIPWCPFEGPLERTKVALLSTAALHPRGAQPFRVLEERLGDPSFRVVPHAATLSELDLEAPYLDRKYLPQDPEVALPRRALDELVRRGLVGAAASEHYSFCGGLVRLFPGLTRSVEALVPRLARGGVGALVLIPTCSICVHTVAHLAGELEQRGFPTVCLSLLPELSSIAGTPRTLTLRFPFGAPCGDPGNAALHAAVLEEALGLLTRAREPGLAFATRHAWRRAPRAGRPAALEASRPDSPGDPGTGGP